MEELHAIAVGILRTLPHHIGVLNGDGVLLYTNPAWDQAGEEVGHPALAHPPAGVNYLQLCRVSASPLVQRMAEGITAVLDGSQPSFEMEHPARADGNERWFHFEVWPMQVQGRRCAVMVHSCEAMCASVETAVLQEEELGMLAHLGQNGAAPLTAQSFGFGPLSEAFPEFFEGMVEEYRELLESALEETLFRVNHGRSARLREMAAQLGFRKAGPRDVVDLHSAGLQRVLEGIAHPRAQALLAEGRMLVLELMGHLVSYYRSRAAGGLAWQTPEPGTGLADAREDQRDPQQSSPPEGERNGGQLG